MIDKWANLLAASSKEGTVEPRYVAILSELSGDQARLLDLIAHNKHELFKNWLGYLEDACIHLESHRIREHITQLFKDRKFCPEVDEIYDHIFERLDVPGAAIIDVSIHLDENSWSSVLENSSFGKSENALDLEILASVGLLKKVTSFVYSKFKHEIQLDYYHMTKLGLRLFQACRDKSLADA